MPDDDFEERLRRTFRWVADGPRKAGEDRSPNASSHGLRIGDDDGAFLDEQAPPPSRRPSRRPLVLVAASVLLLAVVGASVGLVVAGTGTSGSGPHQSSTADTSGARARVISALGATTAAGNWNITYSYTQVPGRNSTSTTTVPPAMTCPTTLPPSGATGSGCAVLLAPGSSAPDNESVTVTGTGVIDVNPKAMVTTADPSDFGTVIIRLDSSQLWELGSDDGGGLAPGPSVGSTSGQSISGFASLVESTLGAREGAVAMLGIAQSDGLPGARRAGDHWRHAGGARHDRWQARHRVSGSRRRQSARKRPDRNFRRARHDPRGDRETPERRALRDRHRGRRGRAGIHHSVDHDIPVL